MNINELAAIGTKMHGGEFKGIARGENGEPDAFLIALDATPPNDEPLTWNEAMKWAESLGDGAQLPSRAEAALDSKNTGSSREYNGWYWLRTQNSSGYAYVQNFEGGNQDDALKDNTSRARAVRRLSII